MQRRVAYVGARAAELTIMVTQHDLSATIDLSIPQVPSFSLRVPLDHQPSGKTYMFHEMISVLQVNMVKYLLAVGIPQELVDQTYYAMERAVEAQGGDATKSDRSGAGGDPLLERLVALEPLEVFEVRWKLPDGLDEAIHRRIVTASGQKVTRPPQGPHPGSFPKGHPPTTLKQNYPSVRNIVQKFRNQQNKPLTGPAFVLVYDVNGRPVGVRSIKGPNWGWLTRKATLFQRRADLGDDLPYDKESTGVPDAQ